MNIYEFMSDSPWLTFFLAYFIAQVLVVLTQISFKVWNRTMRHWNINKHGYPPSHCDADGDPKKS